MVLVSLCGWAGWSAFLGRQRQVFSHQGPSILVEIKKKRCVVFVILRGSPHKAISHDNKLTHERSKSQSLQPLLFLNYPLC